MNFWISIYLLIALLIAWYCVRVVLEDNEWENDKPFVYIFGFVLGIFWPISVISMFGWWRWVKTTR
jgi:hypothetical protein